jgi:hypothetical protein
MPTGTKEGRHCRVCGCVPAFNEEGCCLACTNHPAPHVQSGRFNPRCALCWTDVWRAIPTSIFICAWRSVFKLGQWCSGLLP